MLSPLERAPDDEVLKSTVRTFGELPARTESNLNDAFETLLSEMKAVESMLTVGLALWAKEGENMRRDEGASAIEVTNPPPPPPPLIATPV
jgi:hypothetical protein